MMAEAVAGKEEESSSSSEEEDNTGIVNYINSW
jgi:hypothetical protein